MKKYLPILTLIISVVFVSVTGCNKPNDDPPETPETNYRMTGQKLELYDEGETSETSFVYEEEKLVTATFKVNGEVYSRSHFTYSGNTIQQADSNFNLEYFDSVPYVTYDYETAAEVIIRSKSSLDPGSEMNYNYSGPELRNWTFKEGGESDTKGDYTYQGDLVTKYEVSSMNENNQWEVFSKSEFEVSNNKISVGYYFFELFGPITDQPIIKKEYVYEGDLIDKLIMFGYDEDTGWVHQMTSDFTYDGNGNLVEVFDYAVVEGTEVPYQKYTFTYEEAKGNKETFDGADINLPIFQMDFPTWGLNGVGNDPAKIQASASGQLD